MLMSGPWNDTSIMAQLISQVQGRGAESATLSALIEQASEAGATRALARIGLSDADAGKDIHDLRELLAAWRDAKRSAGRAAIDWIVRGALALLLIIIAVKLGLGAWLR